jgi:hypothetical protein
MIANRKTFIMGFKFDKTHVLAGKCIFVQHHLLIAISGQKDAKPLTSMIMEDSRMK